MQQHHTGSTGTLGKLCERNEHSYEWKESQTPIFSKKGKFTPCKCDNFVPIVIPGLSKKIHLTSSEEESAESIKELTPDEQETTLASRSRLQDLPEWVKEFKENLVEPKPTSSDSDSRDPPEPPRPDPLPSAKPNGKHNLFTHFPKDRNCEICKRTKITRAACRRFSKSHLLRAINFGDVLTADHKIPNEDGESRNQSEVCNYCARFDHPMDSKLPMQNNNFTRNDEKSTEVFRSRRKSKGDKHRQFIGIWKSSCKSSWKPLCVYTSSI